MMSSVREVLPGKEYFIPAQEGKENPLDFSAAAFLTKISEKNDTVMHCIVDSFTGLSPSLAIEMCFRAGIDSDANINSLTENEKATLSRVLSRLFLKLMLLPSHLRSILIRSKKKIRTFLSLPLHISATMKKRHLILCQRC